MSFCVRVSTAQFHQYEMCRKCVEEQDINKLSINKEDDRCRGLSCPFFNINVLSDGTGDWLIKNCVYTNLTQSRSDCVVQTLSVFRQAENLYDNEQQNKALTCILYYAGNSKLQRNNCLLLLYIHTCQPRLI